MQDPNECEEEFFLVDEDGNEYDIIEGEEDDCLDVDGETFYFVECDEEFEFEGEYLEDENGEVYALVDDLDED